MRGLILLGDVRNSQYVRPFRTLRAIGQTTTNASRYCEAGDSPHQSISACIRSSRPKLSRKRCPFTTQSPRITRRGLHSVSEGTAAVDSTPPADITISPAELTSPGVFPDEDVFTRGDENAREEALAILAEGQPGRVMAAFVNPKYRNTLANLPSATYVEALRLISRTYFLDPYKDIQSDPTKIGAWSQKAKGLREISQRFYFFLKQIVAARRSAGGKLGLAEYTHILDCAKATGAAELADQVWKEMAEDNILPSVECYNYYMESKNWHNAYFHKENHHLRAGRWNYKHRRQATPNPGYTGFSTGPGGVRDQVFELFKGMTAKGLEPDAGTYAQLLIAAGREGDIGAVRGLLKSTWNIDAKVLAQDPSQHPPVTPYPRSSPLHPTPDLLFAIAHAIGSNCQFATALQTIDFISISYSIRIPAQAWHELFVWSYVLTAQRYRPSKSRVRNPTVGSIPLMATLHTFYTMTSEPYSVTPSFRALHLAVKLRTNPSPWAIFQDETLDLMRTGRDRLFETVSERNRLVTELNKLFPNQPVWATPRSPSFRPLFAHVVRLRYWTYLIPRLRYDGLYWQKFYEYQLLQMRVIREETYVRQWLIYVLRSRGWIDPRRDWDKRSRSSKWDVSGIPGDWKSRAAWDDWTRRGIPNLIAEWQEFLPKPLSYRLSTGTVEFDSSTVWPDGNFQSMADPLRRIPRGYKGRVIRPSDPRPFRINYYLGY
jgi:hypothetical protein